MRDPVGTPAYMAPELHANEPYMGWAADVWSLGVLLFIMLTGTIPFLSSDVKSLPHIIRKGEYKYPPNSKVSALARDLIYKMLNVNPAKRPTVQ